MPERHEHGEALRPNAFDERNDGEHFADACPMNPDHRATRAGLTGHAVPLRQPFRVFAAALKPPRQQSRRQRRCGEGHDPVKLQRERQTIGQTQLSPVRPFVGLQPRHVHKQ